MSKVNDIARVTAMREGGKKLRAVKHALQGFTKAGVTVEAIEKEAWQLIEAAGGKPNFAMVPGYKWATCIMLNEELCHGIPKGKTVKVGDVVSIDVGMLYKGYHLDTSISFAIEPVSKEIHTFLEVGQLSLDKAIDKVKAGASVFDVSKAMQKTVEKAGYGAVYQLTGHGVGEELHMEPGIPCVAQRSDKRVKLAENQTIAVEIMYSMGNPYLVLAKDGWTYSTQDNSVSAMFEETVLVTKDGFEILT